MGNNDEIVGYRTMLTYSEMPNYGYANIDGGMSNSNNTNDDSIYTNYYSSDTNNDSIDSMTELARVFKSQKDKLHEELLEKIVSHVPNNDLITAKAIKSIMYSKSKEENISGLDRVQELLKSATNENINKILNKNKDEIDRIVGEIHEKNADSGKSTNAKKKTDIKKNTKTKKKKQIVEKVQM